MTASEKLINNFKIGESYPIENLIPEVSQSVDQVLKVRQSAYSPYYNFLVGAVIVTEDGEKFSGVNSEVINGDGLCAEASAMGMWTTLGKRKKIDYIVVAGAPEIDQPSELEFATSCGRCRQRLIEHCNPKVVVICLNQTFDKFQLFQIGDLLPNAYYPKCLK